MLTVEWLAPRSSKPWEQRSNHLPVVYRTFVKKDSISSVISGVSHYDKLGFIGVIGIVLSPNLSIPTFETISPRNMNEFDLCSFMSRGRVVCRRKHIP